MTNGTLRGAWSVSMHPEREIVGTLRDIIMTNSLKSGVSGSRITFREDNSLRKAMLRAARHWKFSRNAIFSMKPVPVHGLGTMGVDKHWRLAYDPKFVKDNKEEMIAGVILHELLHLTNNHHRRLEKEVGKEVTRKQMHLWNIAADLCVNDILARELPVVSPDRIYSYSDKSRVVITTDYLKWWDDEFIHIVEKNLPVELNYRRLKENDDATSNNQQANEGAIRESGIGFSGESGGTENNSDQLDEHYGDSPESSGGTEPTEGSSGHNNDADNVDQQRNRSGDEDDGRAPTTDALSDDESISINEYGELQWDGPSPGKPGAGSIQIDLSSVLPDPGEGGLGLDQDQIDYVIEDLAKQIHKNRSNIGADMVGWAETIVPVRTDPYQKILRVVKRFAERSSNGNRRTYRRFNRRSDVTGIKLPSREGYKPDILICLDTSASMDDEDFAKCKGAIKNIFNHFDSRTKLDLYMGDTELKNSTKLSKNFNEIEVKGGGGTDVGLMITESLEQRQSKPDVILAFTDGETPWPEDSMDMPVIAVLTRELRDYYPVPDWIHTIVIK